MPRRVEPPPLLTTPARAFQRLGVPKNRGYGWIRKGLLPAVRDGHRLYIAQTAVDELAKKISRGEWLD